jgi:hypothetical protein
MRDPMTDTLTTYAAFLLTTDGLCRTTLTYSLGMSFLIRSASLYLPFFPRYDTHINVECVMSRAAAKYITKYTHKRPNRATLQLQQRNEVSDFKDSGYIAASEATWRLFEFVIHHQEPAVISLQIHLPGQHMVVFDPHEATFSTRTAKRKKENK